MTLDVKDSALRYAEMARVNYERDGELAPVLIIEGEKKSAICLMKGSDDMPLAYGRTISMAATLINPTFVITVTEVWRQALDGLTKEDALKHSEQIRRGDLAKFAEAGDPTVRTALMTVGWTMDPTEAVSVIDTVLDDKSYDRHVGIGEPEGHMVECVIGGWRHGLSLPPPPFPLPDEMSAQVIGLSGDVVGVIFQGEP